MPALRLPPAAGTSPYLHVKAADDGHPHDILLVLRMGILQDHRAVIVWTLGKERRKSTRQEGEFVGRTAERSSQYQNAGALGFSRCARRRVARTSSSAALVTVEVFRMDQFGFATRVCDPKAAKRR